MIPFKKFFKTAGKIATAPIRFLDYLGSNSLEFEDYIGELFNKALVKWGSKISSSERLQAAEATKQLEATLKEMGYDIVKAEKLPDDDYPRSYHQRSWDTVEGKPGPVQKRIGLSRYNMYRANKREASQKNIGRYLKRLFTLAHEAGHALQYEGEGRINLDQAIGERSAKEYIEKNVDVSKMDKKDVDALVWAMATVFYELTAWMRAMHTFIPEELHPKLLQYAKGAYMTYVRELGLQDYVKAPFIQRVMEILEHNIQESKKNEGHLLVESTGNLNKIRRELLHMKDSRDLASLPPKAPYGFWVDRSGNYKPVGFYQHHDEAVKMLETANDHLHAQDQPLIRYRPKDKLDTHRVLFENGWARVVCPGVDLYYEIYPTETLTESQKRFLSVIKKKYDKTSIKRDSFGNLK